MSILARHQGNREEVIELLRNTSLKYKEIAEKTGVPLGTVNGLGPIYRPPEVRKANRRRAGIENLTASFELRSPKEEVTSFSTAQSSSGITRTVIFSYKADTDSPISKEEFLAEISHLQNLIRSATKESFCFDININIEIKEAGLYG